MPTSVPSLAPSGAPTTPSPTLPPTSFSPTSQSPTPPVTQQLTPLLKPSRGPTSGNVTKVATFEVASFDVLPEPNEFVEAFSAGAPSAEIEMYVVFTYIV